MRYLVLDLETSGLYPSQHEVIEFGWVTEDDSWQHFAVPFSRAIADDKALEINGWDNRDKPWREFPPVCSHNAAINQIRADFKDRLIVSSPAHFDMGFMSAYWLHHAPPGEREPWGHRQIIDLKSVAAGLLGLRQNGWGNSELAEVLKVKDTSDHTALQDARYTRDLFKALVNLP